MSLLRIPLARIAHARSGDKADWVDFGLFAWNAAGYALLAREVTAERVRAHFAPWLPGEVDAWALPNILAMKFVLKGALQLRPAGLLTTVRVQLALGVTTTVSVTGSVLSSPQSCGSGGGLMPSGFSQKSMPSKPTSVVSPVEAVKVQVPSPAVL